MTDFPDTPWSLIAQANEGHAEKDLAIRALLEKYWQPVYAAFCALDDVDPNTAEQRVRAFFDELLSHDSLATLDPETMRFRTFIKERLEAFVSAGQAHTETARADSLNLAEQIALPASEGGVSDVFDEQWALLIVQRAIESLRAMTTDRPHVYDAFRHYDIDGQAHRPEALGAELGIDAQSVEANLIEARKLFRKFVIADLQAYCISREHAGEELNWLLPP